MSFQCTCKCKCPEFCICPEKSTNLWRELATQTLTHENTMNSKLLTSITIPIKTESEANKSEHWTKKHSRHITQKNLIWAYFRGEPCTAVLHAGFPIHVKLIRIAPRMLDPHDNLPCSFKYIKDYIADILFPGQQPGRADDSKDITWDYGQEKGKPKEYGIRIEFYHEG